MDKKTSTSIQMIADFEGDISTLFNTPAPDEVPILATRNMVLFPGVFTSILIGRKQSKSLINYVKRHPDTIFAVFCQKDPNVEMPGKDDLHTYGVYARLVRVMNFPGSEEVNAIVQATGRCRLTDLTQTKPYLYGSAVLDTETLPKDDDKEYSTAVDTLRDSVRDYVHENEDIPDEALFSINNLHHNIVVTNYICTMMNFSVADKVKLIKTNDMKERVLMALRRIDRERKLLALRQSIRSKTREDLDEQQREYFLQQQIKNIKEELGGSAGSPERKELEEKASKRKWSEETAKVFNKELDKLDMLNPQSPEYSIQLTYLQTLVNLPWNEYTRDNLDLKRARRVLDHDHYGMEKVKERILEYMAVLKLRGDLKSPIICLYGPPGVGKTSLGKSIAAAMKRKYVRMSLGGLHDESEIRGHRRTYIGAMPGRIVKNIQKAGSSNPVFILDEIDKVTQNTVNGDPASALLEVLDP